MRSETLSREYRVTESAQEIVDSIICNCEQYIYVYQMSTPIYSLCRGIIYKNMGILLGVVSDCEELSGRKRNIRVCVDDGLVRSSNDYSL